MDGQLYRPNMTSTQTTQTVFRVGTASDAFNLSFIIRSGENSSPVGISSLVLSLKLCLYPNLFAQLRGG